MGKTFRLTIREETYMSSTLYPSSGWTRKMAPRRSLACQKIWEVVMELVTVCSRPKEKERPQ
jgi:hypothetical protein